MRHICHIRLPLATFLLALSLSILPLVPALAQATAPAAPKTPAAAPPASPAQPSPKPQPKPKPMSKAEEKKAIAALPQAYRDWLDEVALLITAPERQTFLRLDKDYERDSFIERFWESRSKLGGIISANEFRNRWQDRVAEARRRFGGLTEDRSRIFLLNGPPSGVVVASCSEVLWPLEVWYYSGGSDVANFEFIVVFYQKWGVGGYRIWEPLLGAGDLFRDGPQRFPGLEAIQRQCRDGDQIAGAIAWVANQGTTYDFLRLKFDNPPKGPGGEWIDAFKSYSTDLPESAASFNAKLSFDFPGRYQNRTVVEGVLQVPVSEVGQAKLGEHRSFNFVITGEVLENKKLFDGFRYKFDFPVTDAQPAASLPLVFQRYLRPGSYTIVLKVEDLNSGKFFRAAQPLTVPETDKIAPAAGPPADPESARILAEAYAAISNGETTLKLVRPQGELQTGMMRFDTISAGKEIAKVTFSLDGKPVLTKTKQPWSVELDLGSLPRQRALTAVAYDAQGREVASDRLLVNAAGHRFAVRLSEPHKGKRYEKSLLAHADVQVPEGETVEQVEFYLNETRVATVYQPPYEQPIVLPKNEPLAYVRAVATTADGATTEDLVFVNAPENLEQVNIQFVELYASVLDHGRPVEGLTQKDFTPSEDGVKQQIARFDQVRDQPIHAAVAIDVSASMDPNIGEARKGAFAFFQQAIKPKDRAALITFNDHPNLVVKFTNDVNELAGGLAGLKAERGTALYDSVVFSLFYFNGVKGQRALLILSDGKDEGSRFTFEDALEYARRAGVTIYAIGLGKDVDKKHLSKIAEETGGRGFFVKTAAELAPIYAQIERELRSQYLVAYQSTNTSEENTFRAVELKVDKPGVEVKTIRGYYP
ncbi:MAG TPA: VWA domain-containing protein [Thermoanaerobaculia bacterium]